MNAPMIIKPSLPMLMMPERSIKRVPMAPISIGAAMTRVVIKKRVIRSPMLKPS